MNINLNEKPITVGVGGFISEYGKPLFSMKDTYETILRQTRMVEWYSKFNFDIYVMQDQLISKEDAKFYRDNIVIKKHNRDYLKLGNLLKKYHLDSWVHTGHFISLTSPWENVKKRTKIELKRFADICKYSDYAIRHITTHFGGRYKQFEYEEILNNAINLLGELKFGKLICIENEGNNSRLGDSEEILKLCDTTSCLPLLDIAHYRLLEGKNWINALEHYAEYWEDERLILHYSTVNKNGTHLPMDPIDFKECVKQIYKTKISVAIELEVPQNTRIRDTQIANKILKNILVD